MHDFLNLTQHWSPLVWIIFTSLIGGFLSVGLAAVFALNLRTQWIPMLVSYAIGAMLGAVFLEILPHALSEAKSIETVTASLLFGLLTFFLLEKLVIWRHCHGNHCEVHAMHTEANCPDHQAEHTQNSANSAVKFKAVQPKALAAKQPQIFADHAHHHHTHDHGRSGMMIMLGDTFHNFIDGILIAAAFMVDVKLGLVTALAIIAHEIPQEVGDFLILLHSGYSKKQALIFNLVSSVATMLGGMIAYYSLQTLHGWIPMILSLAAASLLYVAVADLIPGLHKKTEIKATIGQVLLIGFGVATVWIVHVLIE